MYLKYAWYVIRHKWFVFLECCKLGIPFLGIIHDWSKFTSIEFESYALNFFGPWKKDERPQYIKDKFDFGWLNHLHRNKHHWDYWVLFDNVLPMPDRYCREMLADWNGAGMAITGTNNTREWYLGKRDEIKLHPDTRDWIEQHL